MAATKTLRVGMSNSNRIHRDIIVIGASAGATPVLTRLAALLPSDFPPVLLVRHIGSHQSVLPELLSGAGRMRVRHAVAGDAIEPGNLLIAPPDQHMLVADGVIRLTRGAKENLARPAIDPLFRSAAACFGPRVIGVVLSGRLDDGTAGLQAIKACGGLAIVQDPADALEPSMPRSALRYVAVDWTTPGEQLAATLQRAIGEPIRSAPAVPAAVRHENDLSMDTGNDMSGLDAIGRPSKVSCPACGGVLWHIDDSAPPRYRCHTGHAYTLDALDQTQARHTDDELWRALRALHERQRVIDMLVDLHGEASREGALRIAEQSRVATAILHLRSLMDAGVP
ncbi:chemotaxis protein CheB [Stenotrophomonas sp. NPDC078853]|uniref:chemotaxis protein CheB n=1 Tax=Stenotrophomonas sp. NPDC078853 TaxID=3364534 RepID=UPI0038516225